MENRSHEEEEEQQDNEPHNKYAFLSLSLSLFFWVLTLVLVLVLVDLFMPGMDGFEFLSSSVLRRTAARVAVVSASERQQDVQRAWSAGASGYIPKSYDGDRMLAALTMIANGVEHWPMALDAGAPEVTLARVVLGTRAGCHSGGSGHRDGAWHQAAGAKTVLGSGSGGG